MPAKRTLTMSQLWQVLRLAGAGTSAREIGRLSGVARSTVQDAPKRAQAAKVCWPLPVEVTDEVLEQKLFARADVPTGVRRAANPAGRRCWWR